MSRICTTSRSEFGSVGVERNLLHAGGIVDIDHVGGVDVKLHRNLEVEDVVLRVDFAEVHFHVVDQDGVDVSLVEARAVDGDEVTQRSGCQRRGKVGKRCYGGKGYGVRRTVIVRTGGDGSAEHQCASREYVFEQCIHFEGVLRVGYQPGLFLSMYGLAFTSLSGSGRSRCFSSRRLTTLFSSVLPMAFITWR